MAHRTLDELGLPEEGVTLLAIRRKDGAFVGVPQRSTVINPHDVVVLYGRANLLAEISGRQVGATGEKAHRDAMSGHRKTLRDQDLHDSAPWAPEDAPAAIREGAIAAGGF